METLGTIYGGWGIPKNAKLNKDSIVYSGGVGEDMSFDLLLQDKYNCNILLIDPTQKAIKHFDEVKNFYNDGSSFTGNIQSDYLKHIYDLTPDFEKFTYINKGLYNKQDTLKFYKQSNPEYVSQSLNETMFSDKYDLVQVDTIKNIMSQQGHQKIDLLKLDIEGSEIEVLNQMLDDKIYPRYLCIEFDLLLKQKDPLNLTQQVVGRIQSIGYKILLNNNLNITFELCLNV